jgi:Mg-chelatase subunit ChlD
VSYLKRKKLIVVSVLLTIMIPLFAQIGSGGLWASETERSGNLAVVMVIDVSGSMERTDPDRLRETASRMLIDLLGVDDYLGLITFGSRPTLVAPLQPLRDAARKEELIEKLSPGLEPGGSTDFLSALELVHRQFSETDFAGRQPVVLLLTDGEPNPDPDRRDDTDFMEAHLDSLWELVDTLSWERIPIYTVGFSAEIDPAVVRRFSRDTGGEYYILDEAAGLLVAFFEVLADLKGRLGLLSETIELQGSSEKFTFTVDEYTRQVNLVAVNVGGNGAADLAISVSPPRGERDIAGLSVSGRGSYAMAILSLPQQEHYGVWGVTVTGSGETAVMGNADLYLEAVLLEPAPSSHHPLHEPMNIRVALSARENLADLPFEVALQITGPADRLSTVIPLAWEDGLFRGTYAAVDQPGDYRLQLQVQLDGEPVYTTAAVITVKLLPVLVTDFWANQEGFRLGEEQTVTASLQAGGNRLPEGVHLQVDSFALFLKYRDGQSVEVALFDDGDPAHGNIRAGDGIWSNHLVFGREGLAQASLAAAGAYRDTGFRLEKNLGDIFIGSAGTIAVAPPGPDELLAAPGRRLIIPLQVENRSPFTETLLVGLTEEAVHSATILQREFTLEPGGTAVLSLEVALSRDLEPGSHLLPLSFSAGHPLTAVEPGDLEIALALQTLWQYRWQRVLLAVHPLLAILWPFLLAALLLYGSGLLLYRLLVAPQANLGLLTCWMEGAEAGGEPRKVRLGRRLGAPAVVSFNPGSPGADCIIEGGNFSHDLIFTVERLARAPRFLLGWRSLIGWRKESCWQKRVECTPPGVIEAHGAVYTCKELFDRDEFKSGGWIFRYYDATIRRRHELDSGANLLKGKM